MYSGGRICLVLYANPPNAFLEATKIVKEQIKRSENIPDHRQIFQNLRFDNFMCGGYFFIVAQTTDPAQLITKPLGVAKLGTKIWMNQKSYYEHKTTEVVCPSLRSERRYLTD